MSLVRVCVCVYVCVGSIRGNGITSKGYVFIGTFILKSYSTHFHLLASIDCMELQFHGPDTRCYLDVLVYG
jgi:hypothetical protein